jgi:hypothetical protein
VAAGGVMSWLGGETWGWTCAASGKPQPMIAHTLKIILPDFFILIAFIALTFAAQWRS